MPETIEAYADSDYAGCIDTRHSTSGGYLSVEVIALIHGAQLKQ